MSEMDRILRKKLFEHESAMPDDMWSRIESGLEEKKRDKGFAWLWLIGILFMATSVGVWFYANGLSEGDQEFLQDTEFALGKEAQEPVQKTQDKPQPYRTNEHQEINIQTPPPKPNSSKPVAKIDEVVILNSESLGEVKKSNIVETPAVQSSKKRVSQVSTKKDLAQTEIQKDLLMTSQIPRLSLTTIEQAAHVFPDPLKCTTFARKRTANIFGEVFYKPSYAHAILRTNSSEVGQDYLDQRKETEFSLYSWSAGVNLGWVSAYNIGLKAGLEYEVINERFVFEDPDAIRNQTVITIDTVFNSDGTFQTTSDTSVVQVSGTEVQRIHNYHKSFSIPIIMLYQMNFGDFAIEFSGGPVFNINYANRGKILDPTNQDRWFTKGASGSYDVFKDRLGISLSLSVSAMYSVNKHIQVFARPDFKYNPTSISRNSSPFTQRYLNSGIAIGMRYYLSGNPNF
ncbi:hypothetical protein [Portibacter marinus]|uniref:hypothetical protein n=1 Tax=Portibacter marinus TaxID=2898660 RepID=UPI001F33AF5B|nr:hypothetical protein [Portibacter marinus]